jgi:hypothetical protein
MSHDRKIDYLIKHRVIYRQYPQNDKPTLVFDWGDFYEDGTYECYELFKTKAKINTYKSLKWHLLVIWYLNPSMNQDKFESISKFISDIKNNFVTFNVSEHLLNNIIYEISMEDLEKPPKNKLRKIIFKDFCGLTSEDKLKIVGQLIGRKKISETEIYDAMLYMHEEDIIITISKIAEYLKCSTRTIHRNMSNDLKKEKELLNKAIYEKL